jgi:MFS transporter, SP family, general alpha glucoside:H+ symporter
MASQVSQAKEVEDANADTEKGNPQAVVGISGIIDEAKFATAQEHQMSLWQGIKLYPKAIGWSVLLSTAIIMEGYGKNQPVLCLPRLHMLTENIDVVLLGSFYAYPSFNAKYGQNIDGTYQLTAAWQAGLSNGVNVGEILGLFVNGIVSERYGYRKTMIVSLIATIAFIFISFFSQNLQTLLVGEILLGIPLGVFQTLTVSYASEVCPVVLRAYLTTYVNLCWVIGQFIASGKTLPYRLNIN